MSTIPQYQFKGPAPAPSSFPGAEELRIGIVHARWNSEVIEPLVRGAVETLSKAGVKQENIVIESVPGSWELPFGVSRVISAAQIEASSHSNLLTGATSLLGSDTPQQEKENPAAGASKKALDAVIGVGVLIKGSTMHFEYIADAACHGLMRVGLDTQTPVILGILTCLTEDQALERAGVGKGEKKGHNHGSDWGVAALEMSLKNKGYAQGKFSS